MSTEAPRSGIFDYRNDQGEWKRRPLVMIQASRSQDLAELKIERDISSTLTETVGRSPEVRFWRDDATN